MARAEGNNPLIAHFQPTRAGLGKSQMVGLRYRPPVHPFRPRQAPAGTGDAWNRRHPPQVRGAAVAFGLLDHPTAPILNGLRGHIGASQSLFAPGGQMQPRGGALTVAGEIGGAPLLIGLATGLGSRPHMHAK